MVNRSIRHKLASGDEMNVFLEGVGKSLGPYMTSIGRFLLVATFLEDSLRIYTRWTEQMFYMQTTRGFSWLFSALILGGLIGMMNIGVFLVLLTEKHRILGSGILISVVAFQIFAYGLLLDFCFLLKSGSLVGGLVFLMAGTYASIAKKKCVFGGLPIGLEAASRMYLPLFGRILLILLCGSFVSASFETRTTNLFRLLSGVAAVLGGIMVAFGFQAKPSAAVLIVILSLTNIILLNDWWSIGTTHPKADFLKYDFFQTLSIMGGFLLLIEHGPGEFSVDMKNKQFTD